MKTENYNSDMRYLVGNNPMGELIKVVKNQLTVSGRKKNLGGKKGASVSE